MSSKTKGATAEVVSDANIVKSLRKYSKKQAVSEKELQLPKKVNLKHINRKQLLFEKVSPTSLACNMPHPLTDKSKSLGNGTTVPENGFPADKTAKVQGPAGFLGQDWDEMEFLGSSASTTNNEALNGKYARTRKNLGKKMSIDAMIGNGLGRKISMGSAENNNKSTVINSPIKRVTPRKTSLKPSILFSKASSTSKEDRPSLLDMVKKFSANTSLGVSENPPHKASLAKSDSSLVKYLNKIRSEPPRANSVSNGSFQSLVPDSIQISLVPSTSKSALKRNDSISGYENNRKEKSQIIRKETNLSNSQQLKKGSLATKVNHNAKKRSSELVVNVVKKTKCMKDENKALTKQTKSMENQNTTIVKKTKDVGNKNIAVTNKTIYNTSPLNSNAIKTDHTIEKDMSWLNTKMTKGTTDLRNDNSTLVNSVPQVLNLDTSFKNRNIVNPPSYVFTPSLPSTSNNNLPNTLNNTFIQPSVNNNNLIYDVNSLSLYQPVANPPSSTVFILPVAMNSSTVLNASGNMNIAPLSQSIIKVSCNGMDADSVFRSICKNFYQSSVPAIQNSENVNSVLPETSSNIIQSNPLVHASVNVNSGTSTAQQLVTPSNNLLIPRSRSDSESNVVREVTTIDRSSLLFSYFCELMKNRPKLSVEQYKKESKQVLDLLSSFPHYLTVKYFCNRAQDFFSDLCFCNLSSQSTTYKFDNNFEESCLNDVLKKYVSFHIKEIVKAFPNEPFSVKSNLIFKPQNSKLTYFEKLILKKMLKTNQKIDLEELINRLFFVGLVVVFNEFKKQ